MLAKFSIYLTIPSFDDVEKSLNQNVSGSFFFNNLGLTYNFTEAFSELDIEPKFPFKIKLSANFCTNKSASDTKPIEIKVNIYFILFISRL